MSEGPSQSYRRRNVALAVIAAVFVVAAIFRVVQTAKPEAASDAAAPVAAMSAAATPAPQPLASVDAAPGSSAAVGASIVMEVAYAGAVEALPETAKVYVFIRPVGQRMPLGVQTYGIHDLPVAVEFSNPTAGTQADAVEVVARLSISGAVALQPGDLEAVSSPLKFGEAPQSLSLLLGGSGSRSGATAETAPTAPAAPMTTAANSAPSVLKIPVHLALGPHVALPPTTTVFLIVRATDGSPMPLAVKRFVVSDLPKDLSLSEADAMVPGRSIRAAASVELVARASINGNVKPVPGDYEGRSGILKISDITAPVVLLIEHPL